MRWGDLGHPQIVAVFLIVSSVLGIANFAIYPVFSQNYPTAASVDSNTTGYNRTVTVVQTFQTIGFTTSSTFFTQIMVAFVTSTTFFTYVQITFTNSTSTIAYPAPPIRPKPSSGSLKLKSSASAKSINRVRRELILVGSCPIARPSKPLVTCTKRLA